MASSDIGPTYYRRGVIQVWDFIRDQGLNFHLGNAIKYICRAGFKDSAEQDLEKAIHYLTNELDHLRSLRSLQRQGKEIQGQLRTARRDIDYLAEAAADFDR